MNTTQDVNKMTNKTEIINDAVHNLERLTGLEHIDCQVVDETYDYDMSINGISFACVIKNQVTKANYNLVVQQMRVVETQTRKPLLLVANHFVPEVFSQFSTEGINVIESNGNCNITVSPLFVHISGQKSIQPKESLGRAFKETGLKVIFYFLLNDANIGKPYRVISKATGASLGAIKNVIEELYGSRFAFVTDKGRILKDKKQLLESWQMHYNQTMKPKLLVKEMDFIDGYTRKHWDQIKLPEGMYWGGEGAAFLLDHYLVPETFDIYTDEPTVKLLMTRKVKLQKNGPIKVYQKFWNGISGDGIAPRILVYADLMGSGNSRCIEAAQRLMKDEL